MSKEGFQHHIRTGHSQYYRYVRDHQGRLGIGEEQFWRHAQIDHWGMHTHTTATNWSSEADQHHHAGLEVE